LETIFSKLLWFNPLVRRSARLPSEETCEVQIRPLSDFFVDFNMFCSILLHWIVGYANSIFIITIKSQWFIPLYPQVFQNDFHPLCHCHELCFNTIDPTWFIPLYLDTTLCFLLFQVTRFPPGRYNIL
jgi:hypothetical protein